MSCGQFVQKRFTGFDCNTSPLLLVLNSPNSPVLLSKQFPPPLDPFLLRVLRSLTGTTPMTHTHTRRPCLLNLPRLPPLDSHSSLTQVDERRDRVLGGVRAAKRADEVQSRQNDGNHIDHQVGHQQTPATLRKRSSRRETRTINTICAPKMWPSSSATPPISHIVGQCNCHPLHRLLF